MLQQGVEGLEIPLEDRQDEGLAVETEDAFEPGIHVGKAESTLEVEQTKYSQADLNWYRQDAPALPLSLGGSWS